MNLPSVGDPDRYVGLFVFDFGEWCAVGYTADEVAMLLESEAYRSGKAYQIRRVTPEGGFELAGMSNRRFDFESGIVFFREHSSAAQADFDALRAAAEHVPASVRAFAHLVDFGSDCDRGRYATALVYPAEQEHEVSRWLLRQQYAGGDWCEGGSSVVTRFYERTRTVLDRFQVQPLAARSRAEVLSSVRRAVQR